MSCLLSRPLTLRLIVTSALLGVCFLIAPHAHTIAPPAGQLQFSVSTYTAREGANVAITVTRTGDADRTFSIGYATQDNGTARAGADYVATNGTLTFLPGQTEQTFTVTTLNDEENDDKESIRLMLDKPTGGATLGAPAVASLIITREALPLVVLDAAEYNVTEGGETANATVAVKLSEPSSQIVTVDYGTYIGGITRYPDATPERDFIPTSGTLTFAPGQTRQTITIPLINDSLVEDPESFGVNLRDATNASLVLNSFFYVNIIDDDAPAGQLQFESATYSNLENTTQSLVVRRIGGKTGDVTVQYAVTGGTATAGVDYVFNYADPSAPTPTTGTLTLPDGTDKAFLPVNLLRDNLAEPDETIEVTLSDPTGGATLGSPTVAVFTIQNEARPLITSELPYLKSVVEGDDGTTEVSFPVNLSFAYDQPVTLNYVVSDISFRSSAKLDVDFSPAGGTLVFAPGETGKSITITIIGDTRDENDESVILRGVSATNAVLGIVENQVLIIDDDPPPTVSISDASAVEGTGGNGSALRFTLTASAPTDFVYPSDAPSITLEFIDGTAVGARGNRHQRNNIVDYYPDPQTIRLYFFGREQTSLTYSLPIASDSFDEPDETLLARISGSYFRIGDGEATGTIIDDDSPSDILISEFWLRNGRNISNEFVELYNNTDRPFTINATDGSSGWMLVSDTSSSRSDSNTSNLRSHFTIPNGTVIPPRGHYLIAHTPDPNLGTPLVPDGTYTHGILSNKGIALLSTANPRNLQFFLDEKFLVDAVGFVNSDLREGGAGLSSIPNDMPGEHSFVRRFVDGKPQDTTDNAADFVLVSTTGGMFGSIQSVLGAPGAENLSSPVANIPPVVRVEPIDNRVPVNAAPNLIRDATPIVNGSHGTLIMHRTLTNDGDEPLTRLRFRIINLPTLGTSIPGRAQADLRALSSSDARVTLSDGSVVPIVGLTLEDPSQPLGGGLNSTLAVGTITIASPLKAGARVNVGLRFGIERSGRYRLGLLLERDSQTGGRRSMRGRSRNSSSAQEDVIR